MQCRPYYVQLVSSASDGRCAADRVPANGRPLTAYPEALRNGCEWPHACTYEAGMRALVEKSTRG
jgi:hypothetical protein